MSKHQRKLNPWSKLLVIIGLLHTNTAGDLNLDGKVVSRADDTHNILFTDKSWEGIHSEATIA